MQSKKQYEKRNTAGEEIIITHAIWNSTYYERELYRKKSNSDIEI